MRVTFERVLIVLMIVSGLMCAHSLASDSVLSAIPADAEVIAVVHNLADTSQRLDDVAALVHAPPRNLLDLAKQFSGLQRGIDEQGDVALVLTIGDGNPQGVLLVPVSDFAEFFAGLQVQEPVTGVVEVQLAGGPKFVGRKGEYAAISPASDRAAVERLVSATTNLATDAELAERLEASQASVVVTSHGLKQLLPKLISGIQQMQATFRQMPGDQGKTAADAFNIYLQLFTAAEREVEQFSIALRIDSDRNVDVVKRIQFQPEGTWAKLAAEAKPAVGDLLAGLPAGPFVVALGGVLPPSAMEHLMKFSVDAMQQQPMYNLTREQAEKYGKLSMQAMSGLRSMRMLLGVPQPGGGLYSNATAVMSFDDSEKFLSRYEESLAGMREMAEEVKSPLFPVTTVEHIKVGSNDALKLRMDMSNIPQLTPPDGPDSQKMMQALMGPGGELTIYLAAADENTVVMSYTSLENLQSALELYKTKQPGILGDAGVAKVAAELPAASQFVGYVSLAGATRAAKEFAALIPGAPAAAIPDFPPSPPLGMAAKVSPSGVEGHLVVLADTLRAIGEMVARARGSAAPQP
jgi:hypothetical protein